MPEKLPEQRCATPGNPPLNGKMAFCGQVGKEVWQNRCPTGIGTKAGKASKSDVKWRCTVCGLHH